MDFLTTLIMESAGKVWVSLTHNWPFLAVSVVIATLLKLYTNQDKIAVFLLKYKNAGIVGATAAAVGTPLCSCGTTAVVLGMMASLIPWAPIVAFMVASPLSSPEELIYSAGLFGWPFALAYFMASILLGLVGGAVAAFFESRGWLKNQNRMGNTTSRESSNTASIMLSPQILAAQPAIAYSAVQDCCGSNPVTVQPEPKLTAAPTSCRCGNPQKPVEPVETPKLQTCSCSSDKEEKKGSGNPYEKFFVELFTVTKQLMVMFTVFAFLGFFLNGLIPEAWMKTLFGQGNTFSVPLAATLGLPFYISSEGSLPFIRSLIEGGMDQGAAMAFLITGAGTSIGAITGALTIARWRVIAIVVGTLWVGAVIAGYFFNLLLTVL